MDPGANPPRPRVKIIDAKVNIINGEYTQITTHTSNTLSDSLNVEGQNVNQPTGDNMYPNGRAADQYSISNLRELEEKAIRLAGPDAMTYRSIQSGPNFTVESSMVVNQNDIAPMSSPTGQAMGALFADTFHDDNWVTDSEPIPGVQNMHGLGGYAPPANFGLQTMLDFATYIPNTIEPGTTTTTTTYGKSFAYTAVSHSVVVPPEDD